MSSDRREQTPTEAIKEQVLRKYSFLQTYIDKTHSRGNYSQWEKSLKEHEGKLIEDINFSMHGQLDIATVKPLCQVGDSIGVINTDAPVHFHFKAVRTCILLGYEAGNDALLFKDEIKEQVGGVIREPEGSEANLADKYIISLIKAGALLRFPKITPRPKNIVSLNEYRNQNNK